jgi:hypothetical protein
MDRHLQEGIVLILPTIHINGTSKEQLYEDLCNALYAVSAAREAVQAAAPNGRDYYTQSGNALQQALAQHAERLRALQTVYDELEAIAEHIQS